MINSFEVFQTHFNKFHSCDKCGCDKHDNVWFGYVYDKLLRRDGVICYNCVNKLGSNIPELLFVGKVPKPYWTFNKKIVEI